MFSVRSLLLVWASTSLATLGYAYVDLNVTPELHRERGYAIHVDFERVGELWHWGGRLLNEGAVGLLFFNAVMLGGFLALVLLSSAEVLRRLVRRRRRAPAGDPPVSTTVAFGSIPPPAG